MQRLPILIRLALLNGLLPIATVAGCYSLSVMESYIPGCIPLLEGCTSISAAGRYGPSYWLFKAGMLPAAFFLARFWRQCHAWITELGAPRTSDLRAILVLGFVAAAFLVLYTVFLGSKGDIYSLLRRFGVTVYFSFTYLAQLLLTRRLRLLQESGRLKLPRYTTNHMLAVSIALLAIGLISIPVGNLLDDKSNWQNIIEWNFALLMSIYFFLAWRAFRLLDVGRDPK
ncbi:MAG: hypothetical protein ACR2P6_07225 [Gammaproteobacteria bacterium]